MFPMQEILIDGINLVADGAKAHPRIRRRSGVSGRGICALRPMGVAVVHAYIS